MGSAAMIPRNQISRLTQWGFVVVTPEYRLCPQVSLYDGPMQDAKDVYLWCQAQLPSLLREATGVEADDKRVVAWGHSAGGNMALSLVCGAVSPCGVLANRLCRVLCQIRQKRL